MMLAGQSPRRGGLVLLTVLGILTLLSALMLTFISMTNLESTIGRNYVDRVRAKFVAENGIEAGISAILQLPGGVMDGSDAEHILYYPHWSGMPGRQAPALHNAGRPSLDTANNVVDDGLSGVSSSTYAPHGDEYAISIEDESGKLNINDAPGVPAPARLYDMIHVLSSILFHSDVTGHLVAQSICLGRDRQGGRFSSMNDVRNAIAEGGAILSPQEWLILESNITLHSWQDASVITPTYALPEFHTGHPAEPDHPAVFITRGGNIISNWLVMEQVIPDRVLWDGFTPYGDGQTGDIHAFLDFQTAHFKTGEARAPVNVNTCKLPLLKALIAPIRGWYLDDKSRPENWSRKGPRGSPSEWFMDYVPTPSSWSFAPPKYLYWDADTLRKAKLPSNHLGDAPYQATHGRAVGRNSLFGVIRKTASLGDPLASDSVVSLLADAVWNRVHGVDADDDGHTSGPGDTPAAPFSQWQEFADFIRGHVDDPAATDSITNIPGFTYQQADAVIANFNPNANINDYNPDLLIHRAVDKARLAAYTTELCFEPTGAFSIRALGYVRGHAQQLIAECEIQSIVRVFECLRVSTQAEFMEGYTEDSPDPSALYSKANAAGLPVNRCASFSESDGMFHTAGSNWDEGGNRRGYTLVSYPEPLTIHPAGHKDSSGGGESLKAPPRWHKTWNPNSAANEPDDDYNYYDDSVADGWLGLATWQPTLPESRVGATAPIAALNFNKTLRPAVVATINGGTYEMMKNYRSSGGGYEPAATEQVLPEYPAKTAVLSPAIAGYHNATAVEGLTCDHESTYIMQATLMNFPTADRLTRPFPENALDPRQRCIPGVLLPDGALSDAGRTITFHAANVGSRVGKTGSIHMWIKPNFDPAYAGRIKTLFNINRYYGTEGESYWRHRSYESFECFYFCRRGNPNATATGNVSSNFLFNQSENWGAYNAFGFMHSSWANGAINASPSNLMEEIKISRCTNRSFPGPGANPDNNNGIADKYNFEGRKWNHLGLSWDYGRGRRQGVVVINGQLASERQFFYGGGSTFENTHIINLWADPYGGAYHHSHWERWDNSGRSSAGPMTIDPMLYVRLGMPSIDTLRNYSADCTYDEVFCYANRLRGWVGTESDGSTSHPGGNDFLSFYQSGRYYPGTLTDGDAPVFTSAPLDLHRRFQLNPRQIIRPRSASWTLYWPQRNAYQPEAGNRRTNANLFEDLQSTIVNPGDRPNAWLVNPQWDPIAADFYTSDNHWIHGGDDLDLYNNSERMATCAAGSAIGKTDTTGKVIQVAKGDEFRFRLYFNVASAAVYETPVLDDVTLTFTTGLPVVLSWYEGQTE